MGSNFFISHFTFWKLRPIVFLKDITHTDVPFLRFNTPVYEN